MQQIKPKLIPSQVPWSVASGAPHLQLIASEMPAKAIVKFVAFFGAEQPSIPMGGFPAAEIRYSPHESNIKLGRKDGPEQIVSIEFDNAIKAQFVVSFSDLSPIDPDAYDFSAFTWHPYKPIDDPSGFLENYRQEWQKTGICPNPGMYEVSGSEWLVEGMIKRGFGHYLILGHDAYIEVIAKAWSWESEGALRQSQ